MWRSPSYPTPLLLAHVQAAPGFGEECYLSYVFCTFPQALRVDQYIDKNRGYNLARNATMWEKEA